MQKTRLNTPLRIAKELTALSRMADFAASHLEQLATRLEALEDVDPDHVTLDHMPPWARELATRTADLAKQLTERATALEPLLLNQPPRR